MGLTDLFSPGHHHYHQRTLTGHLSEAGNVVLGASHLPGKTASIYNKDRQQYSKCQTNAMENEQNGSLK